MQFKNQQAIDALAKLHAGGFPSAIVAGGCVRDEIFGKHVKDIDVFVSYEDAYHYPDDPLVSFTSVLERSGVKEDWSTYMDIPDVDSVYSIQPLTEELPVQIIVMKQGLLPLDRLSKLDWGFCQVAWDGKQEVWMEGFSADYTCDTITLIYCENQKEYDRSMVRYERLKQKYPEFKLVIPQEYQKFISSEAA